MYATVIVYVRSQSWVAYLCGDPHIGSRDTGVSLTTPALWAYGGVLHTLFFFSFLFSFRGFVCRLNERAADAAGKVLFPRFGADTIFAGLVPLRQSGGSRRVRG